MSNCTGCCWGPKPDFGFSGFDSPAAAGGPLTSCPAGAEQAEAGAQHAPVQDSSTAPRLPSRRGSSLARQTFILTNIQRLITPSGRTKSGFLHDQAVLGNALLVAVTETWLDPLILDSEVTHNFPGYSIIRCDRESRQGGGVALYIREDLTTDILCSFDNGVCELLAVMIHQLNTVVMVAYRPPNTRLTEFSEVLSKLDSVLQDLPTPTPTVTLMGDFNFPKSSITWSRGEGEGSDLVPVVAEHREGETAGGKQDRLQAARLCDLAVRHCFVQQVDRATHGTEILDLILTNNHDLVSSVSVDPWPRFTDHSIVTANVSYHLRPEVHAEETHLLDSGKRLKALNFNKAKWVEIQTELNEVDWTEMKEAAKTSPTEALNVFMEELLPLLERHVPLKAAIKKTRKDIERRRKLMWKRLYKVKTRIKSATSIHKLTKLLQDKQVLEEQLLQDYSAMNSMEENQAVLNMKSNPKAFYSFAKSRQKTRSGVGPFIDPASGSPNPDPEFAASELSKQYSSVFVPPRAEWKVTDPKSFFNFSNTSENESALEDIPFTEEDIMKACAELKSDSAAGADGIPSSLLKLCRRELARPLYLLWRSSLDHGCVPSDLLLVIICPVHKGGSRGVPKNYRPVALTSHLVKVFERVIRKSLVTHLERNGYFPDGQHGFRALRSTLTQLLSFWDSILDKLENDAGVDVIYTDFSKAFDKVETGVLLHKMNECEIKGKVGCWIASFLDPTYRQQAVVVDGTVSNLSPVISGVPQGTVLGPVLFLIHISDIASGLSAGTTATSFADDTRLQRCVRSEKDCSDLQSDLQLIYSWAERVNMHFNSEKFECLRFWPGSGTPPAYDYRGPNNSNIEVKKSLKDLGVQISSDLSFRVQVEKIVAEASKLVGWALRTFSRRNKSTMKVIWQSLIQPKIDYCSQLWSPSDQNSIAKLESIQRHFTSKVKGMEDKNYWDRLKDMQLYSQERRRERYILIFLWKMSQGMVSGYQVTFSYSPRRGRMIVPNQIVAKSPAIVRRAREASLAVKGAKLFNLLPAPIRNIDSDNVEIFKKELD